MSTHTEWGHAGHALYTLHPRQRALEELRPDDENDVTGPFVLGLWNGNGDGLALQGTRREILDYLRDVAQHVERETDPRAELDQALKRLHALRQQRAEALDSASYATHPSRVDRLDEQVLDLLIDVADAAEIVNAEL